MAAYKGMYKVLFNLADLNRLLAVITACRNVSTQNISELEKMSKANSDINKLKEFNDLIFILEVIKDINDEITLYNLQQHHLEVEDEFRIILQQLSVKSDDYKASNNIRMYNEIQALMLKKLIEEYKKVIEQLNSLKSLLENQLLLSNRRIYELNAHIEYTNALTKNLFKNLINSKTLNLADISEISINNEIIKYDTHEFVQRIIDKIDSEIESDNFSEEFMMNILDREMYKFFLEIISESKNFLSFSHHEINDVILETISDFKTLIKNELSNSNFYELLFEKKDFVAEKEELLSRRELTTRNLSTTINAIADAENVLVKATSNDVEDFDHLYDELVKFNLNANLISSDLLQSIHSDTMSLETLKPALSNNDEEEFLPDNEFDSSYKNSDSQNLSDNDNSQGAFENNNSNILESISGPSVVSAPGGAPIEFDMPSKESIKNSQELVSHAEPQSQPQPIKPANSTLSLYQKLGIKNPGLIPTQDPNEMKEAKHAHKINISEDINKNNSNFLTDISNEHDESRPKFRR